MDNGGGYTVSNRCANIIISAWFPVHCQAAESTEGQLSPLAHVHLPAVEHLRFAVRMVSQHVVLLLGEHLGRPPRRPRFPEMYLLAIDRDVTGCSNPQPHPFSPDVGHDH